MRAWTPEQEPVTSARDVVTTFEGSSFCICAPNGDLGGTGAVGVFFRDTRILRSCDLTVDGAAPEPLTAMTPDPFRAVFLGRVVRGSRGTDANLVVERERRVGNGAREDVTVRNFGPEPVQCRVTLAVDADFADLFEVKEGAVGSDGGHTSYVEDGRLVLEQQGTGARRATIVESQDATLLEPLDDGGGLVHHDVLVPARGEWTTTVLVVPVVDGDEVAPALPSGEPPEESVPAVRMRRWREGAPEVTTPHHGLQSALRRSQEDLGALRIFDEEDPATAAVAAGAPWFMALFGRDSLLTALMALPVDRDLALGTLRTLARHQGSEVNPRTEEEPGRILHEVRRGAASGQALGGGTTYYGTADATPLFVVLLGELERWGADPAAVAELLPHADRALRWVEEYGDRDGDGFVEYQRSSDQGLESQGWKDSWNGVNFADGRMARSPVALCEVQGYVHDAYRTRARLAGQGGDPDAARAWSDRADALRTAFNEQFWLPDRGWYAIALDGDKRPVDACASNMGHCLWSGIVDEDKAPQVVEHLMSPEMFTGWGIRTLSSAMGAYDPVSYHNGSVWPHDNALVVAGLVRYGFVEEARRVAVALLEAAEAFGGRLPELFCGFDRAAYPEPVPYPTSCSPQAWAAATPIQLVRSLLRLEPRVPEGRVDVEPALPEAYLPLRVRGLRLGPDRVDLEVTADGAGWTGPRRTRGWSPSRPYPPAERGSGSPNGASVGLPPP